MSRPKHRTRPGGTYFITANTWERRALFAKPEWAEIVERKIFAHRDKGEYLIHRYVVMPDHIHMILTPGPTTTLERAAQLIKGGSSYDLGACFGTKYPVWQPGFAEHSVRSQSDYDLHSRYIDMNPVRARLAARAEEYSWCSARAKYVLDPWRVTSGAQAPCSAPF